MLTIICAAVAVWYGANRVLDEDPLPARDEFALITASSQDRRENIALAMLGITAPSGQDFMQYGAEIRAMHTQGASSAAIYNRMEGPGTLQPTVNSDQIRCWTVPELRNSTNCLAFSKAVAVIQQNATLLQRFKRMQGFEYSSGSYFGAHQVVLVLVHLNLAEIRLDIQERRFDEAYRKWVSLIRFSLVMLQGEDLWLGKLVASVVLGFSLPHLEMIAQASPEQIRENRSELLNLLSPGGIEKYNTRGVLRAEYTFLLRLLSQRRETFGDRGLWPVYFFGQRQRVLNRSYLFFKSLSNAVGPDWARTQEKVAILRQGHVVNSDWELVFDPFGSHFLENYVESQLLAEANIRRMFIVIGRLRLASLYVEIISDNVKEGDIPAFLALAGRRFYDPFTGGPMQWDAKQRRIYFPDMDYKNATYDAWQIPADTPAPK